jgi:predicted DNA-binding transcriptional regulator AlpA
MTKMLKIIEVRDMLGLSCAEVINLVQSGRLRAYRYAGGGPISRSQLQTGTTALRFRKEDIEQMIEASLVK